MVLLKASTLLVLSQLWASSEALGTRTIMFSTKNNWDAYNNVLTIPEVINMTAGGSLEMQIGMASHNWTSNGSISGTVYGYGLRNSTPTFPGPTILVARAVPITVTWYNTLTAPHLLDDSVEPTLIRQESHCYPYCGVPVVTHIHGAENPAKYDGLPIRTIYENQNQTFVYQNNQSASTKLYHDHANGLTRLNTWAGLMGAYIIEDSTLETSLNVNTETDIPLLVADRLIDNNGTIRYSDDICLPTGSTKWIPESVGTVNLVNGVVMPYVEIPPAQVRLRWANTANARRYNFSLPFASLCKEIARDSGFVENVTTVSSHMLMYPFERVEMICDFTGVADSTAYNVTDIPPVDYENYDPRVMQFRINSSLTTGTMTQKTIPSTLVNYKSLKQLFKDTKGKNRVIFIGEQEYSLGCPVMDMIKYRDTQISTSTFGSSLACTKGKVERWHFRNPTDDPHPFHWHLVNAQCGETEDTIETNYLKDVAPIPNAGSSRDPTTITQICYVACTPDEFLVEGATRGATEYNFNTSEPYLAHCHVLEHEENAMMSWFQITDVDDDAPDDDGTATTIRSNKVTTTIILSAMGMSILGGMATTVSVLVISVERLKFLADARSLSVAFSLSAGVMVFIAFADLYPEAISFYRAAFTTGGVADPEAYETGTVVANAGVCDKTCGGQAWLATGGAFFGGVIIILIVEYLSHQVFRSKGGHGHSHGDHGHSHGAAEDSKDTASRESSDKKGDVESGPAVVNPASIQVEASGTPSGGKDLEEAKAHTDAEQEAKKEEFRRSGIMTGVAIAIHNFPEGLALFVSSLGGLRSGIVLSVGIILHNLPEGVAVAAPVYYATGSKLEAFKWTFISGVAQPIGAFIGWVAVSGGMSYGLQASLYASVAGMLACITAKELLPGAFRFDPKATYFVLSFFIGVAIMAGSLVFIHYAGSG